MSAGSSVDNSKNWSGKTGRHSSSGVGHVYHARSYITNTTRVLSKNENVHISQNFK